MKASEWIAVLEELIEVCGDVDVTFDVEDNEVTLRAKSIWMSEEMALGTGENNESE